MSLQRAAKGVRASSQCGQTTAQAKHATQMEHRHGFQAKISSNNINNDTSTNINNDANMNDDFCPL
jgi:hypothetical protein